ncbi:hypothetical protein [Nioella sp.]|uniref:hypothetical protein n=1 Tax=Nioella sp. TaxID=1912091 RepID=UPI003B525BC6
MGFLKPIFTGLSVLALAGPAMAQDWGIQSDFSQGWFFAGTGTEGGPISFNCAGHYPSADWSYGEGGGPYDPYIIHVSMTEALGPIDWSQPDAGRRSDVIFSIGGLGYQFPQVQWNEMVGDWGVVISMGDPLITALLAGGPSELWAGDRRIAQLSGTGLSENLAQAIRFCDDHWAAMGVGVPQHAAQTVMTLRGQGG